MRIVPDSRERGWLLAPGGSLVVGLIATTVGLLASGCGAGDSRDQPIPPDPPMPTHEKSAPSQQSEGPRPSGDIDEEEGMLIRITIGNQEFEATLDDSAASRDLVAQLPVAIDMVDHGSVEKTGPLPEPLSLDGQPGGADPDVGDVGYYAPGNNFVLYYGDQSYYSGIAILGRMQDGAARRLAAIDGAVTATVESMAP